MSPHGYGSQSAGLAGNSLGGAGGLAPGAQRSIGAPSLEDRLRRLTLSCERLSKLRARVASNVSRIQPAPPSANGQNSARVSPEPSSLSERFALAIDYVQDSCDELEYLTTQIEDAVFGNACEVGR